MAGLSTDHAFDMGVVYLAVGFLGTVLSWALLSYTGRRPIYVYGVAILATIMFIIGILDCNPDYSDHIIWTQSTLMVIWNGIYDLTIGPVCFVIICEVSATKVRSKTIAVATAVQATANIVMTIAVPYMINPDQLNMRGKLGFVFGVYHSHMKGALLILYRSVVDYLICMVVPMCARDSWEIIRRAGHHV